MVSSLNQVRQLYVANKFVAKDTFTAKDAKHEKGDITVKAVGANTGAIQKQVYFLTQGYDTVLKSDYIPVESIVYAKAMKAAAMATPMKKVLVTLVDGPIAGQDYILRINLRQFYGMSDQDQYFKDAAVHAIKGMDKETFYSEMVKALNLCFSREVGATISSNPYLEFTSSADGIVIEEKEQSWHLGTEAQERVVFDVVPTTVYDGTDDVIWGKAEQQESTTLIPNGKKIADLEYFLLGERGDQYRKIGWPNDIETKGLVDADKEYDVFEIHYSFSDTGVNNYKTEKDITIVAPTGGVIDEVIAAFNEATGLSVAKLSDATGTSEATEEKAVVDTEEAAATEDTAKKTF